MNCERCGRETRSVIGSYFNTDMICVDCEAREKSHPLYTAAILIKHRQLRKGNFNYPGIGLPNDLKGEHDANTRSRS